MKNTTLLAGCCCLVVALAVVHAPASDCCDGHASCVSCTGGGPCCEPRCKGSWDEVKTKKSEYSMKCEYACARGRDSWHAPEPECRCSPPCGKVYVKKRLYKAEGKEKVERVSKYEVEIVAAEPCSHAGCCGTAAGWWNPLMLFPFFHSR